MLRRFLNWLLKPEQGQEPSIWQGGKLVVTPEVMTLLKQAKLKSVWHHEQEELIHAQVCESLGIDPESDQAELVCELVYDGLPLARFLERLEGMGKRKTVGGLADDMD